MKIEYRWRMLAFLWVAFLLNQADRAMFGFLMPLLKTDLGLSDVQLGLVATTFHVFYGILAPVAGFAGDYFRRSRVVFAAILTWSAATVATGFSTCIAHLVLFRGASLSFGEAFYLPAANSLIGECHEKTKGTAMAIHQTALYCGMIGSGAVAGWLGVRYGWRSPFFLFGALGLLWAVVLFFGLREPAPRTVEAVHAPRISFSEAARRVFGETRILLMGVVFGCLVFGNVGYVTWIPTLLHEKFALSLAAAGFTSMLWHVLCAIGGVMVGGRVSDWLRNRTEKGRLVILAAGFTGCVPFLVLMGLVPSLVGAVVGLALFGFFRGVCDATFFPSLIEMIAPAYRSSCQGVVIAFGLLIGALAPIGLAWIKGGFGLSVGLASLGVVAALGAALTTSVMFLQSRKSVPA